MHPSRLSGAGATGRSYGSGGGPAAATAAIQHEPMLVHEPKRRTTVFWLCLLFGWLGIHRFYVGKRGTGRLYLLTGGVFLAGVIVDLVLILMGTFEDGYGQPLA